MAEHGNAMLAIEARILLVCARRDLDPALAAALDVALTAGPDWQRLLAAAARHFLSPLLARHLLARDRLVPDWVQSELRAQQRRCAMVSLKFVQVQQELVSRVLWPRGIRHAFFKGAAMAQAYYGDAGLRHCRDIDVLVDPDRTAEVGEALLATGYEITNGEWPEFQVRDLRAFCRYLNAMELRSPQGVQMELHRRLDSTGCIFSTRRVLDEARPVENGRFRWNMPQPAEHFVYLCYHHARHRWSSLHWCADISVLTSHPDIDIGAARQRAAELALDVTLEESLLLEANLRELAVTGCVSVEGNASRFLPDCLSGLQAALAASDTATQSEAGEDPDFRYDWQESARYRRRLWLARWRPSTNDVNAMPLPTRLHWLYYLLRPLRAAVARLKGPALPARIARS